MSEECVTYQVATPNVLSGREKCATMEQEPTSAPLDLLQIERMLLPLLNQVRRAQGKKPVIVPRG